MYDEFESGVEFAALEDELLDEETEDTEDLEDEDEDSEGEFGDDEEEEPPL